MKILSLRQIHQQEGARFAELFGWEIPTVYSPVDKEYKIITKNAGLLDLSFRGRLLVAGPDTMSLLNGIASNDVSQVTEITSVQTAFLNRLGRVLGIATAYRFDDGVLLDTDPASFLNLFRHISEQAAPTKTSLRPLAWSHGLVGLVGPSAEESIEKNYEWFDKTKEVNTHKNFLIMKKPYGYTILVPVKELRPTWHSLSRHASPVGWDAFNRWRIECRMPVYGIDITDQDILLETGLPIFSETKGCYLGQEIIVRMISRKAKPAKKLCGFVCEKAEQLPVGPLTVDGKEIGTITSSAVTPDGIAVALGYLKRGYYDIDHLTVRGNEILLKTISEVF